MVTTCVKVRAGYYDALLPKENDETDEFYHFYKTSMPVFNDFFDTGSINFEEQEVERITRLFIPFNDVLVSQTGLGVKDFIDIYNAIDNLLEINSNYPLIITKKSTEAKEFWDEKTKDGISPRDWNYDGNDANIIKLSQYFNDRGSKFTISIDDFEELIAKKASIFLDIFSLSRSEDSEYLYYTQQNKILTNPIYKKSNGEFIVISRKQIVHAIFKKLHNSLMNSPKKESYLNFRGNWLQNKTEELLRRYFGKDARIFNEYKVDGKANDVLLLHRGLALIIENKAHQEVQFSGIPDVKNIFKQYYARFKKSIQDGYEQAWRIKDKFYYEAKFTITDLKNNPIFEVDTRKYKNVFSIIITQDRFREPQINIPSLLKLDEDDDTYPLSLSIDDFEVLILAFIKMKVDIGKLIHFLRLREQLQGRLKSNDELELWGSFLQTKRFKIPEEPKMHFQTNPFMAEIFDQLYEKGLGFDNERNLANKKSGNYMIINSVINKHIRHFPPR